MPHNIVQRLLILVAGVSLPLPVLAHDASLGDQMLQPVTAAQSLLALLAVALVCRQNILIELDRNVACVLGLGLAAGLATKIYLGMDVSPTALSLALASVAGGLAALARPMPAGIVVVLILGLGLAVGANLHVETAALLDMVPALAAAFFATFAVLLLIAETAKPVPYDWHAIALRVAGSWIAAVSVIVLALTVRGLA